MLSPTEREAFEKWASEHSVKLSFGDATDVAEMGAEWGIAYERKRTMQVLVRLQNELAETLEASIVGRIADALKKGKA